MVSPEELLADYIKKGEPHGQEVMEFVEKFLQAVEDRNAKNSTQSNQNDVETFTSSSESGELDFTPGYMYLKRKRDQKISKIKPSEPLHQEIILHLTNSSDSNTGRKKYGPIRIPDKNHITTKWPRRFKERKSTMSESPKGKKKQPLNKEERLLRKELRAKARAKVIKKNRVIIGRYLRKRRPISKKKETNKRAKRSVAGDSFTLDKPEYNPTYMMELPKLHNGMSMSDHIGFPMLRFPSTFHPFIQPNIFTPPTLQIL